MIKDKKLRRILWGFWHTHENEDGGPNMVINRDYSTWKIPVGDGVIPYLLMQLDLLKDRVRELESKAEPKKKTN